MKDRIPLYPGRVKLNPVTGQENTYDMVRADEPTQEGTPLNKASLLKDATAALYGKGADAVPDDILSILSKAVLAVNGNLQDIGGSNVGTRIETGSYVGTGTYGASNPCSLTFDFTPKYIVISGSSNYNGSLISIWIGVHGCNLQVGNGNSATICTTTWLDNGISWYNNSNAFDQANGVGMDNETPNGILFTYRYIAIGEP